MMLAQGFPNFLFMLGTLCQYIYLLMYPQNFLIFFCNKKPSLLTQNLAKQPGASICRNLWGVQLNNQNFFGEISRILFALFVHRRLCLQCSYVAIAHLKQFFFFFLVLSRLGNKRTVFWKKKEKKTHRGQEWGGRDERVS